MSPGGWNGSSAACCALLQGAEATLGAVLAKARFWQRWAGTPWNERQIKLLNRLLDGFEGKLSSSKWAAIAKCSGDSALRDISDLVARGVCAPGLGLAQHALRTDALIVGHGSRRQTCGPRLRPHPRHRA